MRAFGNAFSAQTALNGVDISEVVLQRNGLELANLNAFTATDTTNGTSLTSNGALIAANARDENAATFRTTAPKLDNRFRASLNAFTARSTISLNNLGQTGSRVNMDSVEVANNNAIALAKATERTTGVAGVSGSLNGARTSPIISAESSADSSTVGSKGARTGATNNSNLGFALGSSLTKKLGNALHSIGATNRAEQRRNVVFLNQSLGHSPTAGKAASTAIGTGKQRLGLVDARILNDVEPPRNDEQNNSQKHPQNHESEDGI